MKCFRCVFFCRYVSFSAPWFSSARQNKSYKYKIMKNYNKLFSPSIIFGFRELFLLSSCYCSEYFKYFLLVPYMKAFRFQILFFMWKTNLRLLLSGVFLSCRPFPNQWQAKVKQPYILLRYFLMLQMLSLEIKYTLYWKFSANFHFSMEFNGILTRIRELFARFSWASWTYSYPQRYMYFKNLKYSTWKK